MSGNSDIRAIFTAPHIPSERGGVPVVEEPVQPDTQSFSQWSGVLPHQPYCCSSSNLIQIQEGPTYRATSTRVDLAVWITDCVTVIRATSSIS